MMIPVLIRVLWLMFDEEGDRLSWCFQDVFTPVSCTVSSVKYVFIRRLGSKLFSMFLPLRVVSALEETTAIAKPYITICFLSIEANVAFCASCFNTFPFFALFSLRSQPLSLPASIFFWFLPPSIRQHAAAHWGRPGGSFFPETGSVRGWSEGGQTLATSARPRGAYVRWSSW